MCGEGVCVGRVCVRRVYCGEGVWGGYVCLVEGVCLWWGVCSCLGTGEYFFVFCRSMVSLVQVCFG